MADIFISYAHADRDRIEKLAASLESKGYSVWWDRHIAGGAEFSKDIETALKGAKVVIVAWSAGAIDSHWVRDEAVYARDNNILIPIRIDETESPLGFRQVQAIDFNDWNGSPDHGCFRELTRSLKIRLAEPAPEPEPEHSIVAPETAAPETPKLLNPRAMAGGIAALAIAVLVTIYVPRGGGDDGVVVADATSAQTIDRSKSIAVLPFADFSPASDQEWFSDGLTEEILNALVRTPDLLVASRTSSFKYKDTNEEIPVIAKRLGVEHVLEGSVRRAGDRLRVTAQLIRASDGFHLWSQNYDRGAEDVIAIQEDIAIEIAKALKTAMDPEALAEMASTGTRSIEAYEAYLEALALQARSSSFGEETPLIDAYGALERARTIDPTFAKAHFAAGQFWSDSFTITNSTPPMGASAEEALQNALERIDLAIANETDGARRTYYESARLFALSEFRAATTKLLAYLEQIPNDARALSDLALIYVNLGEYEKANEINRKNESVGGDDIDHLTRLIIGYLWARDYDAAARISRRAIRSAPNNVTAMYQAHRALLWAGATEEANALAPNYRRIDAGTDIALMVEIRDACANGDRPRAERAAAELTTAGDSQTGLQWVVLHMLGETEEAKQLIVHLDRAAPPYQIMGFLYYPYFDASKFPNASRVLKREGAARSPPVEIPFACPPAGSASDG